MPSDVSQVLAFGMDLPEFEGKSYRIAEPSQLIKAEYETYYKRLAMQQCIEVSQGLDDEQVKLNRKLVLEEIALKKYRWGGEFWQKSLQSDDGVCQLLLLLIKHGEESKKHAKNKITREIVERMLVDADVGPFVWGAIYMVSGLDPQTALLAGKMTISEAKTNQKTAQETLMKLISP